MRHMRCVQGYLIILNTDKVACVSGSSHAKKRKRIRREKRNAGRKNVSFLYEIKKGRMKRRGKKIETLKWRRDLYRF